MLDNLKINFEDRPRKNFYASDFGKSNLDLYFAFTNEPKTNPPTWNETLKWGAGRGVEDQLMIVLKDSGMVAKDYDQKVHGRVSMEENWILDNGEKLGVVIHGYIDAIHVRGFPIEIKSINNANKWDIGKYERNQPRESYVGQLALYMEFLGVERGALFVASIDGLNYFFIECFRVSPGVYRCGETVVDLYAHFRRLRALKEEHIDKGITPDVFEHRYKTPVRELDFRALARAGEIGASAISAARNNRKVIGDFQVTWSDWCDHIIKLQGEHRGYSEEELAIVLEKTKGYSTWEELKPKRKAKKVVDDE
jgi:hypothetical protein